MSEKFDLARMLREISEEKEVKSTAGRALSQEDIQKMIAERKKGQAAPKPGPVGKPS